MKIQIRFKGMVFEPTIENPFGLLDWQKHIYGDSVFSQSLGWMTEDECGVFEFATRFKVTLFYDTDDVEQINKLLPNVKCIDTY